MGTWNKNNIENMSNDLIDIIQSISSSSVSWKSRRKKGSSKKKSKGIPWFSHECAKLKHSLNRAEKIYKKDPFNVTNKENLFTARKQYKKVCKNSEKCFKNKMLSKLMSIESENPEEFWKTIKKCRGGEK